jgi:hypothetical protein
MFFKTLDLAAPCLEILISLIRQDLLIYLHGVWQLSDVPLLLYPASGSFYLSYQGCETNGWIETRSSKCLLQANLPVLKNTRQNYSCESDLNARSNYRGR